MIRLVEIPLALLLIYLSYISLIPQKIETKGINMDGYITVIKSLYGEFSVFLSKGDILGVQGMLEEALEKEIEVKFDLYIPFKVLNTENKTKNCVLGFLYDIKGGDPETIRVYKEGKMLKTMKKRNWRVKRILVNASSGCFSLNLSFPANMNTSCLRAYFRGKYPLKIGWNNTLIVCSPFALENETIDIYYCIGNTIANSVLENVSENQTANYEEIFDKEANITEIIFEGKLEPGENDFSLAFGNLNIEYENSSLSVNCSEEVLIGEAEFNMSLEREIKEGIKMLIPVPSDQGLWILSITIPE